MNDKQAKRLRKALRSAPRNLPLQKHRKGYLVHVPGSYRRLYRMAKREYAFDRKQGRLPTWTSEAGAVAA